MASKDCKPILASQDEISTLSITEREAISRDIFGMEDKSHDEVNDLEMVRAKSSLDLELYNLPVNRKAAHIEATVRCPHIVHVESNPTLFLKAFDLKEEEAACGLVDYWAERKELFGQQAFLPLTKDGAFVDDHTTLTAKVWQLLPDDLGDRAVLFYDPPRRTESIGASNESAYRALFYHVTNILLRGSPQQNLVLVFNLRHLKNIGELKTEHYERMFDLLVHVLPVRVKALHVCVPSDSFMVKQLYNAFKPMLGRQLRRRLVLHKGKRRDIVCSMQEFGLIAESLPSSIGGSYDSTKQCKAQPRAVSPLRKSSAQAA